MCFCLLSFFFLLSLSHSRDPSHKKAIGQTEIPRKEKENQFLNPFSSSSFGSGVRCSIGLKLSFPPFPTNLLFLFSVSSFSPFIRPFNQHRDSPILQKVKLKWNDSIRSISVFILWKIQERKSFSRIVWWISYFSPLSINSPSFFPYQTPHTHTRKKKGDRRRRNRGKNRILKGQKMARQHGNSKSRSRTKKRFPQIPPFIFGDWRLLLFFPSLFFWAKEWRDVAWRIFLFFLFFFFFFFWGPENVSWGFFSFFGGEEGGGGGI